MPAKPLTMDAYLCDLPIDQRQVLEKLRKAIQAAVPDAVEGVSYGLPAFLLNGKAVAAISASKAHCSLFPMSGRVVAKLANDLKAFDSSKGTIRFTPEKPLPSALVKKIVNARLAEIAERAAAKKPRLSRQSKSPSSARVSRPRRSNDTRSTQTNPAVVAFMKALDHPQKKAIEAVRQLILSVSPEIHEGIKWNSPSFRTTEYFATLNLRNDRVWLILHLGAKVKDNATKGMQIADPTGLLKWLAKDRALVTFENVKDVVAKRAALKKVLREWILWL